MRVFRRRGSAILRGAAAAIIVWLVIAIIEMTPLTVFASQTERRVALVERVIDGDTFVLVGGERVRVRNFDTPELRRYACAEERARAVAARAAAIDLLTDRRVTVFVAYRDRFDRLVGDVALHDGVARRDFVAAMIDAGHGARWDYGNEPQPEWCSVDALAAQIE